MTATNDAGNPWRLLLVEDDEDDYILFRSYVREIRSHSVTLDWAETAEDCLRAMKTKPFDLLIVDYHLGGLTGLEVVDRVRRQGYNHPVIFLSGTRDARAFAEAVSKGAFFFIEKEDLKAARLERYIQSALLMNQ